MGLPSSSLLIYLGLIEGISIVIERTLPGVEVGGAAVLDQEVEAEGAVPLLLVDVCDGAHERAQDDFSVILEEVDLEENKLETI